jgi:hypothetical protein
MAVSLAWCFYCDCDAKLFGQKISDYLINNNSVAAPAKCQSANSLVESHWQVMVHMAKAYLTEKQMSCRFWFYAIVHVVCMMNVIPGKICGCLASPFLLVHGVSYDPRTWVPIFSLCYFHHKGWGNISIKTSGLHNRWDHCWLLVYFQSPLGLQPMKQAVLEAQFIPHRLLPPPHFGLSQHKV